MANAFSILFASIGALFSLFGRLVRTGDKLATLAEESVDNLVDEQRINRMASRRELLEDLGITAEEFKRIADEEEAKHADKKPRKAKPLAITQ